jgi:hypothetical protein
MAASPAGDVEHMPRSQVSEPNLVFRAEDVGLELMAVGRGKISRYKNVLISFSLSQRIRAGVKMSAAS